MMGATLRSLESAKQVRSVTNDLFGSDVTTNASSLFGMSLQIPSLPKIDQKMLFKDDGTLDEE